MASKRDQLQSYRFLLQRLMHAVVLRETDPEHPPFRRGVQAAWGGLVIAALALAATWVYGLVVPGGNDQWRDGKSVIVEEETGARYVYLDGVLYPVANYASALLILHEHAAVLEVSRNSLGATPRGPLLGLPGAPDTMPSADSLDSGAWSLCARPQPDAAGDTVATSVLLAGTEPVGGRALGDRALLVRSGAAGWLVWHGYRHEIADPDAAAAALLLGTEPWLPAGTAWLDALPAGVPLGPLLPSGIGRPSHALEPARVGQLYAVQSSGGSEYYLVEADRLRPISPLQYDLQRAAAATRRAYGGKAPTALPLDPAVAAQVRLTVGDGDVADSLPRTRPAIARLDPARSVACATFADADGAPQLTLDPVLPAAAPAAVTASVTPVGLPMADQVLIAPGHGVLVRSMPAPGAPTGPLYFVSDLGRRFALPSDDVLAVLGLGGVVPVPVPAALVARVPAGSPLDPAAALRPVQDDR